MAFERFLLQWEDLACFCWHCCVLMKTRRPGQVEIEWAQALKRPLPRAEWELLDESVAELAEQQNEIVAPASRANLLRPFA